MKIMNFPSLISISRAWGYVPQKNFIKNFLLKKIGHPHPFGRLRARSVMKNINLKNKVLLDAGCGYGIFSRELKLRGFEVTGVDTDNDAIENCNICMEKMNLTYPVFKESIMDLKSFKNEMFDSIIATDVIEHVQDPKKALFELRRVLKKGGQLIMTVPTPLYLTKPILPVNFTDHLKEIGHISQGWYQEDGTVFLNNCGFKVEKYSYSGFFPIRLILEFLYFLAGTKGIKKTRRDMYNLKLFPLLLYLVLCPFLYLDSLFSEKKRGASITFILSK